MMIDNPGVGDSQKSRKMVSFTGAVGQWSQDSSTDLGRIYRQVELEIDPNSMKTQCFS